MAKNRINNLLKSIYTNKSELNAIIPTYRTVAKIIFCLLIIGWLLSLFIIFSSFGMLNIPAVAIDETSATIIFVIMSFMFVFVYLNYRFDIARLQKIINILSELHDT